MASGWCSPAHCERGELETSVALEDRNKIAGLLFKPGSATSEAAPGKQKTELRLQQSKTTFLVQQVDNPAMLS